MPCIVMRDNHLLCVVALCSQTCYVSCLFCPSKLLRTEWEGHVRSCPSRLVKCDLCSDDIKIGSFAQHQSDATRQCVRSSCSRCLQDQYGVGHNTVRECEKAVASAICNKTFNIYGIQFPNLLNMINRHQPPVRTGE